MKRHLFGLVVLVCLALAPATAGRAGYVPVYGLPYDPVTGNGFQNGQGTAVNEAGTAVGSARKYVGGIDLGGFVGVRWDASGIAEELGNLGTSVSGTFDAEPCAINDDGTAVGYSCKYVGGVDLGSRAVRWDAGSTVAVELGVLGTRADGYTRAQAVGISSTGTMFGYVIKYVGGVYQGRRALRWNGTAATELETPAHAEATYVTAVNSAGTAAGVVEFSGLQMAAKWQASGTAITLLGNLPAYGATSYGTPTAINNVGTVVGTYSTNEPSGRPVRWNGTVATELGNLGMYGLVASGEVHAINSAGTAVGTMVKYVNNIDMGCRAVRWSASGTEATELGSLSDCGDMAYAINDAGIAVGYSTKCVDGIDMGGHGVFWDLDGTVTDLNDLIDPAAGWERLGTATAISNSGWIVGTGLYYLGGTPSSGQHYLRPYLIQIPEPATLALLAVGGAAALVRRKQH